MKYQYTKKSHFKHPEKYQMSEYEGERFFKAYFDSRRDFVNKVEVPDGYNIYRNDFDDGTLDKIIKNFEITKRVYGEYSDGKPSSSDYLNLTKYVVLAAKCSIRYASTSNLKYLNTMLKLDDLLLSVKKDIPESHRVMFAAVLNREMVFVESLMVEKEVLMLG